jgi:predicted transcriptional regulator
METTTIQIRRALKKKLEELKVYPNETMDQIIERLTENKIDREPLSEEEIKGIEEGLADIKAGRVYTTKQLKKELGIK